MKLSLVAPAVLAIAIGAGACSSAADMTCQSASGARICLNATGGGGVYVEGSGLQAGSEVHTQTPAGGSTLGARVDSQGRFPGGGGVAGITGGPKPSIITIEATSDSGTPVTFTFHLPAAER